MNTKLLYDPRRLLKLQKNEVLNEFRTRFSQEFYKVFKEAEKQIWNDQDQNFAFLQEIVSSLHEELDAIENSLAQKVQAWSSIEAIEAKNQQSTNKIQTPNKAQTTNKALIQSQNKIPSPAQNNFANIQAINSSNNQKEENLEFEDFDFFDEN